MKQFLRANFAAIVSSCVDYCITITAKEIFGVDPLIAGITGTIVGGVFNFFLARNWVFKAEQENAFHQSKRFLLIWFGNLLLNVAGFYTFIHFSNLNYILAKITVSATVALFYNYPLQKKYVFKTNELYNEYKKGR